MKKISSILTNKYAKMLAVAVVMSGICIAAVASMGSIGDKSKKKSVLGDFTPIRTSSGFTLKGSLNYKGSLIVRQEVSKGNIISLNSVATYQQGNSIYILPNTYKMVNQDTRSNLQMLNFKLKISK